MKTTNITPFGIGFGSLFKELESLSDLTPTYPPYNMIQFGDDAIRLELAVAGFDREDLKVELKDSSLIISGEKDEKSYGDFTGEYIHRGIGARKFARTFRLAQYIEVKDVELKNGILSVNLVRLIPEEKKPKLLRIG
jgi:molecular chaperone IbpA